uniref:hypothetical protein n=1 Tax=Herbaspirillum sp. TaxID=1890675 RepID=UPI0031DFA2BC
GDLTGKLFGMYNLWAIPFAFLLTPIAQWIGRSPLVCAISLPCQQPGDAPVGLSLAAPGGQDRRLLSIARAVEGLLAA